jgi:hypothetical protein
MGQACGHRGDRRRQRETVGPGGSEEIMTAKHDKGIYPARRREMHYIGSCLTCTEEKVRAMINRSRQITYATARRAIGPAVLDAWALSVQCAAAPGRRELQLKDDLSVAYYRSHYDVLPCVYIVHMRIRHIFI